MLNYAQSSSTRITGGLSTEHLKSFIRGMAPYVGFVIRRELHGNKTFEIELPEKLIGKWPEFGRRSIIRMTTDHSQADADPSLTMMDFDSGFIRHLLDVANQRLEFDGLYAETDLPRQGVLNEISKGDVLSVQQIRWQNLSGEILEEEMSVFHAHEDMVERLSHDAFAEFLLEPCPSISSEGKPRDAKWVIQKLWPAVDTNLMKTSEPEKMPASATSFAAIRFDG